MINKYDAYFLLKAVVTKRNIGFISVLFAVVVAYGLLSYVSRARKAVNSSLITSSAHEYSNKESEVTSSIFVDIGGAVAKPGVYELASGARLADLLNMAQGPIPGITAAPWFLKNINLSLVLRDQQKVYIPFDWEVYESTQSIADLSEFPIIKEPEQGIDATEVAKGTKDTSPDESKGTVAKTSTKQADQLNVNSASIDELDTLPGIGPVYAQRIFDNRPYKDIQELQTKADLSSSVVEKIKSSVAF